MLRLNSSTKSFWYWAPLFPPPPYTWLIGDVAGRRRVPGERKHRSCGRQRAAECLQCLPPAHVSLPEVPLTTARTLPRPPEGVSPISTVTVAPVKRAILGAGARPVLAGAGCGGRQAELRLEKLSAMCEDFAKREAGRSARRGARGRAGDEGRPDRGRLRRGHPPAAPSDATPGRGRGRGRSACGGDRPRSSATRCAPSPTRARRATSRRFGGLAVAQDAQLNGPGRRHRAPARRQVLHLGAARLRSCAATTSRPSAAR